MVEQASSSTALDCTECDAVRRNEQSQGAIRLLHLPCVEEERPRLLDLRIEDARSVVPFGPSAWLVDMGIHGTCALRESLCALDSVVYVQIKTWCVRAPRCSNQASLGIGHASGGAAQGARGAHGQLDLSVRMSSCWAAWPWPFSLASLSRPFSLLPCFDPEAVCIAAFVCLNQEY